MCAAVMAMTQKRRQRIEIFNKTVIDSVDGARNACLVFGARVCRIIAIESLVGMPNVHDPQ